MSRPEGGPCCTICDGPGALFRTFGPHRLYRCSTCESLFYSPFLPHDDPSHPWETTRWYLARGANLLFYAEIAALANSLQAAVSGPAPPVAPRVLEIGGSYGFLADIGARLFGWDVCGADPSDAARQGAHDLGIDLFPAPFESMPCAAPYDLLVAVQVIEHLDDPAAFARQLFLQAGENAPVVLTTPDASVGDLGAEYHPGEHRTLLSRDGITRLLTRAGFGHVAFFTVSLPQMLCAAATKKEPLRITQAPALPETVRQSLGKYLTGRLAAYSPGPLRKGLRFRLFELLVNEGRYEEAEEILPALEQDLGFRPDEGAAASIRRIADAMISCRTPDAYQEAGPGCCAPFLFCRGILCLNSRADREGARTCFLEAERLFRHEINTFGLVQYAPLLQAAEYHACMVRPERKRLFAALGDMFRRKNA